MLNVLEKAGYSLFDSGGALKSVLIFQIGKQPTSAVVKGPICNIFTIVNHKMTMMMLN